MRKYSCPFALAISALPRQMNQTRGQFSGASGSSTANFRSPFFRRSTVCATTSASVLAPWARAFFTTSIELSFHCGKNGSQPFFTAFTWRSAVWPLAMEVGDGSSGTGWYSVNSAS